MPLYQAPPALKGRNSRVISCRWLAAVVIIIIMLAISARGVRAWVAATGVVKKLTGTALPLSVAQTPTPITTFVTPGMRVALNAAQVSRSNGTPEVGCVVTNNGGEDLDEVEMLLLDFTATGKINSVVGRKFNGSLKAGAARSLLFTINHPIPANNSLLLAVGATRGKSVVQQVPKLELLQGIIALRAGGNPQGLVVRDTARQQTPVDANFCHTIFRIAHRLTNVPVAGFTCAQGQESFFIAFRN